MTLILFFMWLVILLSFTFIVVIRDLTGKEKITWREILFLAMGAFLISMPKILI